MTVTRRVSLLCVGLVLAQELQHPVEKHASAGTIDMTLGTAPFADYGFDSYGFDGAIPGPTLRTKPGESLTVALTNSLASTPTACSATSGAFCDSMITNLHTHGLHVSSKGTEDGLDYHSDNVLAEVAPGTTVTFKFSIPDNHMGGTHWYHPHHHHATALQAGGGAAGLLIVDDPPGYLPKEFSEMQDKALFISGHNLQTLQTMAVAASAQVLQTAVQDANTANLDTNVFLVNGQRGPTMTMTGNTWHRFRMVYAAVEQSLTLSIAGDATCDWKLLAKDGVYLETIPRDIVTVRLFPGARSDVAISCSCTTYPCEATVNSAAGGGGRRLQGGGGGGGRGRMGQGGQGPGAAGAAEADVDLLILSISEGPTSAPAALPTTSVVRPCYLADLRTATVTGTGNLRLNGGPRVVTWNGNGQSMTYENVHANGGTMQTWPPLTTLQVGGVYEITTNGAAAHPFHIHVNPYQVVGMGADSYADGYFQVGDWHDTLMIPEMTGPLVLRYHTDVFTGKIVLHCHILEHEDEGMMGILSIAGTEGSTFAQAETLDNTCYRAKFDASVVSWSTATAATSSTTEPETTTASTVTTSSTNLAATSTTEPKTTTASTVTTSSTNFATTSTTEPKTTTASTVATSSSNLATTSTTEPKTTTASTVTTSSTAIATTFTTKPATTTDSTVATSPASSVSETVGSTMVGSTTAASTMVDISSTGASSFNNPEDAESETSFSTLSLRIGLGPVMLVLCYGLLHNR
eukprot:TRINITY_DN1403_c0_g1_i1.p1 TRINITY_DN1403_c0_g1~~TRINITY_DN1403_c0_g1_i1.p1  ORF type:complete len:747 (+),score=100.66 TRINITY_DN1403_c0_g1_i1:41-2281(+)